MRQKQMARVEVEKSNQEMRGLVPKLDKARADGDDALVKELESKYEEVFGD